MLSGEKQTLRSLLNTFDSCWPIRAEISFFANEEKNETGIQQLWKDYKNWDPTFSSNIFPLIRGDQLLGIYNIDSNNCKINNAQWNLPINWWWRHKFSSVIDINSRIFGKVTENQSWPYISDLRTFYDPYQIAQIKVDWISIVGHSSINLRALSDNFLSWLDFAVQRWETVLVKYKHNRPLEITNRT